MKARFNQKIQNLEVNDAVKKERRRVAKNLQELGGSFEDNDLDLRDGDFFDKFWDKVEPYSSNTDDEGKYLTRKNKNFVFMKRTFRIKHILRLWKTAYNKVSGVTMIIHHVNKI